MSKVSPKRLECSTCELEVSCSHPFKLRGHTGKTGFEPILQESKSCVLPLHHKPYKQPQQGSNLQPHDSESCALPIELCGFEQMSPEGLEPPLYRFVAGCFNPLDYSDIRRARDLNPDILLECRFSRPVLYQLSQHGNKKRLPPL